MQKGEEIDWISVRSVVVVESSLFQGANQAGNSGLSNRSVKMFANKAIRDAESEAK